MAKIIKLDSHVADLIAAGEVVERPASVVKELVENSIDSGANSIVAEVNAGGMTYIRITDNGSGIAPEDVETAFLRHATSKIHSADGLEAITTLGFRGEALAAIAAVSRIEVNTREKNAEEGISLKLVAGVTESMSAIGCPTGTTIFVRDLFFNTPARQKFVKSDRSEASAISSTLLKTALSKPNISFRYIRDGKTEFHTSGDSRIDSVIYTLLGRDLSAGFLPVSATEGHIGVEGYISSPAIARGNRSYQYFFVNGRPIKSLVLQAALEQAFANALPSGRYPACVLYITTKFSDVDVNIHPAKAEVKFVSDKSIFDIVYSAATGTLNTRGTASLQNKTAFAYQDPVLSETSPALSSYAFHKESAYASPAKGSSYHSQSSNQNTRLRDAAANTYKTLNPLNSANSASYASSLILEHSAESPNLAQESGAIRNEGLEDEGISMVSEVFGTYIIVEKEENLLIIDKHAAHERLCFNDLKVKTFEPMPQSLVTPIICRFGIEHTTLLLENRDLLESLGFFADRLTEDSVAVRAIPDIIELSDVETVLSDICQSLSQGALAGAEMHDRIYRSIACKAAIKAGKLTTAAENLFLAREVISGRINECPHGRPLLWSIAKSALDSKFKRI